MPNRLRLLAHTLFHLVALGLTARLAHWPYLLVLLALALAILPLTFYARSAPAARDPVPLPALLLVCLSPLYAVTALRLLIALIARALCPACYIYLAVPEPFASVLSFAWTGIFCLTAIIVLQAAQVFRPQHHARLATVALAALAILWAAILFPRLIPAGVTGADPFAYVQMGIDLATRGTPMHHFSLAGIARDLDIPIYPTLFVGYVIPPDGDAASVWPPGFSALLAVAFRLFGERGSYILNPLIGLLCAAATYLLSRRVFNLPPFFSLLAAALLLTSFEQTIRLSVPLADLAVQLFTTLAIVIACRDRRLEIGYWEPGICGCLSALAFVTRYTQLLLVPGLLLTTSDRPLPTSRRRQTAGGFAVFIASFFIVSLPDAVYRAIAFGSPFAFAAGELSRFSAADVLPVTLRCLSELAADFNLAIPFIVVGAIALVRNHRPVALSLALILGPVVLFHLPYHYLKLRDLLFLSPTLCAMAALGGWRLAARISRLAVGRWKLGLEIVPLFIVLAFRFNAQLPLLGGFYTYGFLNAEQRAHIESIADLTPPNAVVAASLNSGAISLYANRNTIRPGRLLQPGRTWTDAELITFANVLRGQGRPLFLLMDSEEMAGPAAALGACCRLAPIAELYLPYYYRSGAATNDLITLYRIEFK